MKILDYVAAQNWVEQYRHGLSDTSASTIVGAYGRCVASSYHRESKWAMIGCLPVSYDTPVWRERAREMRTRLDNKSIYW